MPRGKVFNQSLASSTVAGDVFDGEANTKQSSSAKKFTLIMPDAEENQENEDSVRLAAEMAAQRAESQSANFKFTVLLVALFVAVNVGLVTLLDSDKPEEVSSPSVRNDNKAVKSVVVKENNILPAVSEQTGASRSIAIEKPELAKPVAENPVSAPKPAVENPVTEKAVGGKSIPLKPLSVKPTVAGPAVHEDLFSILNKE